MRGPAALLVLVAAAAPLAAEQQPVMLVIGTEIPLVTAERLSSKTHVKGDIIKLKTSADVRIGDRLVIRRGTEAVGQIADARATGGFGMSGRLAVRPLYLRTSGGTIVRLTGRAAEAGNLSAGAVIGMALVTPILSGRSAVIPDGAAVPAMVEKSVAIALPRGPEPAEALAPPG